MVVGSRSTATFDLIFAALGDATRRDIVQTVLHREHSVSELARRYPMSFAAVQKHVAILERADLVAKRRDGREQRVRGNIETLRRAHHLFDQLEASWRDRIDRMAQILDTDQGDSR